MRNAIKKHIWHTHNLFCVLHTTYPANGNNHTVFHTERFLIWQGRVHDALGVGKLCKYMTEVSKAWGGTLELRGGKSQVPHPLYDTLIIYIAWFVLILILSMSCVTSWLTSTCVVLHGVAAPTLNTATGTRTKALQLTRNVTAYQIKGVSVCTSSDPELHKVSLTLENLYRHVANFNSSLLPHKLDMILLQCEHAANYHCRWDTPLMKFEEIWRQCLILWANALL